MQRELFAKDVIVLLIDDQLLGLLHDDLPVEKMELFSR